MFQRRNEDAVTVTYRCCGRTVLTQNRSATYRYSYRTPYVHAACAVCRYAGIWYRKIIYIKNTLHRCTRWSHKKRADPHFTHNKKKCQSKKPIESNIQKTYKIQLSTMVSSSIIIIKSLLKCALLTMAWLWTFPAIGK